MVSLASLWLPVLLSAVIVFVASSVIHMALPWHKGDFKRFDAEDSVLEALRRFNLTPGDYAAPIADSMAEMSSDAYKAKLAQGPQVVMTVMRPGNPMGSLLVKWFVFLIVVGILTAYVSAMTLAAGAEFMSVFRVTSTVAFIAHTMALWIGYIWYSRSLGYTIRTTIDGLLYGLLTAGVFAWLWP